MNTLTPNDSLPIVAVEPLEIVVADEGARSALFVSPAHLDEARAKLVDHHEDACRCECCRIYA